MAAAIVAQIGSNLSGKPREFGGVGAYKEVNAVSVRYDNELKGTDEFAPASYPHYLPVWDNEKGKRDVTLQSFEHYEHGNDADPTFPNLLSTGSMIEHITSSIGAEVQGVQLSSLSNAGKDELALLVAQKKVVAFRDQDFADLPVDKALEWVATSVVITFTQRQRAPAGFPQVHLVH